MVAICRARDSHWPTRLAQTLNSPTNERRQETRNLEVTLLLQARCKHNTIEWSINLCTALTQVWILDQVGQPGVCVSIVPGPHHKHLDTQVGKVILHVLRKSSAESSTLRIEKPKLKRGSLVALNSSDLLVQVLCCAIDAPCAALHGSDGALTCLTLLGGKPDLAHLTKGPRVVQYAWLLDMLQSPFHPATAGRSTLITVCIERLRRKNPQYTSRVLVGRWNSPKGVEVPRQLHEHELHSDYTVDS